MTDTDLLVVVPSRGRPRNLERLWTAIQNTATSRVDLLAVLDDDDDYPKLPGVQYLVSERVGLARSYNLALDHISDWPHRFLALWNDDHLPETPGWDVKLTEAIAGYGFAFGDDGYQDTLPTAPIVSRNIPDTLGWISLPGLHHWYIDNVWRELGTRLGRITKLPDVSVRHLHPVVGLAEVDATYLEGSMDKARNDADYTTFRRWRRTKADADVRDLVRALS